MADQRGVDAAQVVKRLADRCGALLRDYAVMEILNEELTRENEELRRQLDPEVRARTALTGVPIPEKPGMTPGAIGEPQSLNGAAVPS
jgi:hypothetical protein